jgi:hypothetical protein
MKERKMRIAVYNELYAIACNDHIKTEGVRPIIRQSDKCFISLKVNTKAIVDNKLADQISN